MIEVDKLGIKISSKYIQCNLIKYRKYTATLLKHRGERETLEINDLLNV